MTALNPNNEPAPPISTNTAVYSPDSMGVTESAPWQTAPYPPSLASTPSITDDLEVKYDAGYEQAVPYYTTKLTLPRNTDVLKGDCTANSKDCSEDTSLYVNSGYLQGETLRSSKPEPISKAPKPSPRKYISSNSQSKITYIENATIAE